VRVEIGLLIAFAYLVAAGLAWSRWAGGGAWLLLPAATLPWAALALRRIAACEGAALNRSLGEISRLLLAFSLLLALGLALVG
jgi:hypothetical protein